MREKPKGEESRPHPIHDRLPLPRVLDTESTPPPHSKDSSVSIFLEIRTPVSPLTLRSSVSRMAHGHPPILTASESDASSSLPDPWCSSCFSDSREPSPEDIDRVRGVEEKGRREWGEGGREQPCVQGGALGLNGHILNKHNCLL